MKFLFFASIAEITGRSEMLVHDIKDASELKQQLIKNFPAIEGLNFAMAVNKTIINSNVELKDSDEVALLPPFSGG